VQPTEKALGSWMVGVMAKQKADVMEAANFVQRE
jgi:hypothetical protein